jgi:hypothetical protein
MARQSNRLGLGGLMLGAALLAGCESQLKPSGQVIETYITQVTDASGTLVATLHQGTPPAGSGGPANTVAGFAAMVTGGSAQQTISGAAAFSRVVVAMPGVDNYYELALPSGTSAPIILRAAAQLPNMNLPVNYAVADGGALGPYSSAMVRVIAVGTGDVQVSVSWSDSSDVDLHVVDPSGEEIYFGHTSSASGGTLDLDSNAACTRDPDNTFKSNENVVWPSGQGASGTYIVRLTYWSACGVAAPTEWVVTVATAGGTPQVFTGNFTGPGTGGGAGSGILITNFTF